MDGELVAETSTIEGVSVKEVTDSLFPYTEMFESWCPYYMALGMSYEDYWYGDPAKAVAYREMDEIRKEMRNQELWLQGRYIYDALLMVAPLFNSNSKKGTRATPYHDEPYPITAKELRNREERKQKEELERQKIQMETWMIRTNQYFENKKG